MKTTTSRVVTDGLIAGVIAQIGIAAVIAVADVASGHGLLFTPTVLGSALFAGTRGACTAAGGAMPLFAYFAIHLPVLMGFGVLASALVRESERHPMFWFLALLTFIMVAWHLTSAVLRLLGPTDGCVSLGAIIGASAVGTVGMAAYLVHAHPALRRRLAGGRYA